MEYIAEYLLLLLIVIATLIAVVVFTTSGFGFGADVIFATGIIVGLQFLKEAIMEYVEGA
jgi:hypothetical protein